MSRLIVPSSQTQSASTLADLPVGRSARVKRLTGPPPIVQRLYELGLLEGAEVQVLTVAPLGDPIEIRCGPSRLSIRKVDAAGVHLANHS